MVVSIHGIAHLKNSFGDYESWCPLGSFVVPFPKLSAKPQIRRGDRQAIHPGALAGKR